MPLFFVCTHHELFMTFFPFSSFRLPQPCPPLLHGQDEGCFVGGGIPDDVSVWVVGRSPLEATCPANRAGGDVLAARNDLSTHKRQQAGPEGKEIIRIKQDGERCLPLLLASKSAQPEQRGTAHLLVYICMALMVLFLSAP